MKVRLEDDYRKYYTLEELDQAKKVIQYEKDEDECTPEEWAEYAVREYDKYGTYEIIKAEATTVKGNGAYLTYDAYGEGTGFMDVWITGFAKGYKTVIEFGAYLSDIWQTGAIYYKDKMYIRKFVAED